MDFDDGDGVKLDLLLSDEDVHPTYYDVEDEDQCISYYEENGDFPILNEYAENPSVPKKRRKKSDKGDVATSSLSVGVKKQRKRKKPIVIRGCMIVVKGLPCKFCDFRATNQFLIDSHFELRHNVKRTLLEEDSKSGVLDPEEQHVIDETFLSASGNDLEQSIDPNFADFLEVQQDVTNSDDDDEVVSELNLKRECSSTKSKKSLKVELEEDSDSKKSDQTEGFSCWFCKASFVDVNSLNQHVQEEHYSLGKTEATPPLSKRALVKQEVVNPKFYCFECSEQFKSNRTFKDHLARKHEEKKFHCSKCNASYARKAMLTNHFRTNHLLRNLVCQFCKKVLSSIKTLSIHLFMVHEYKIKHGESLTFASPESTLPETCQNSVESFETTEAKPHPEISVNPETETDYVEMQDLNTEEETPINSEPTRFPCLICPKVFKSKKKLNDHNIVVHEEKNILCTDCGSRFARFYQLRRHIKSSHTNETKNVVCPQCNDVLSSEKSLYSHVRVMHKDTRYLCHICDKRFAKRDDLKEHSMVEHRDVVLAKCEDCDEEFETQTLLRKHRIKVHKDRPFTCEHCDQTFTTNDHLTRHIQKIHCGVNLPVEKSSVPSFPCHICGKDFTSNWHLKRHVVGIHSESNARICRMCYKTFTTDEELKVHLNTEHSDKRYECEPCKKTFSSRWHLKRHTDIHHSDGLNYSCDLCLLSFKTSDQLKSHIRSEHEGIRNICQFCEKEFSSSWHLKRHNEVHHSDVSKYQCEMCDNSFKTSNHLKNHVRIEHEGKVSKCEQCEKVFSTGWHLKRHIETAHTLPGSESEISQTVGGHTENNSIIKQEGRHSMCDQCEKVFSSSWHLKRHIQTAHSGNYFACEMCTKSFKSTVHLVNHVRKIHVRLKISCDHCSQEFDKRMQLRKHLQENHSDIKRTKRLLKE